MPAPFETYQRVYVPTLEQPATNPNRLESSLNNRSERDDPPPYVSSSESEEEIALYHPFLDRSQAAVLEEFKDLVSKPLNDNETRSVVETLDEIGIYSPGIQYSNEASREHDELDTFFRTSFWMGGKANAHVHDLLKSSRGEQRGDVIVRHNIRKRWQRLGIWNPEWGIPGRVNRQPNDNVQDWKWKWQSTADLSPSDPRHPIRRAVQLRSNLACGEYAPPPPRSHLRDDSSASEAESFIISRPWFIWEVEKKEFRERERRIPVERRAVLHPDEDNQVTKWWKERGDWMPGWKWRHESPSPEPEDLTPLNTDDMDFTPSEVDAFEALPLTPPPARHNNYSPTPKVHFFGNYKAAGASDARSCSTDESEGQLVQDAEEQPPTPPRRRRGRPRKQSQSAKVAATPPPPPRRSARIALRNANPRPPPPPVTARATRTRMPRGPPASPPPAADTPKKRGRPRKTQDGAIAKPAAATTKRGRRPGGRTAAVAAAAAAAVAVDGKVTTGAAAAEKRPRGRPRRTG